MQELHVDVYMKEGKNLEFYTTTSPRVTEGVVHIWDKDNVIHIIPLASIIRITCVEIEK